MMAVNAVEYRVPYQLVCDIVHSLITIIVNVQLLLPVTKEQCCEDGLVYQTYYEFCPFTAVL